MIKTSSTVQILVLHQLMMLTSADPSCNRLPCPDDIIEDPPCSLTHIVQYMLPPLIVMSLTASFLTLTFLTPTQVWPWPSDVGPLCTASTDHVEML